MSHGGSISSINTGSVYERTCDKTSNKNCDAHFLAKIISELYKLSPSWSLASVLSLESLVDRVRSQSSWIFFKFNGAPKRTEAAASGLGLTPISRWPQKNGWSFHCWFSLDKTSEVSHTLYSFQNNDGLGFFAHLEKEALVLTIMRYPGKGIQHRVGKEFELLKWYMLTIVHVYNRWGRGEIHCYVDGVLLSSVELSWHLNTESQFSRCSLGSACSATKSSAFCGRVSTIMGFGVALSAEQVDALYQLGPEYQGQFRFESECQRDLSETHRRLIYGGQMLYNSLMFAYVPAACDQNLCVNRAPKCPDVFGHSSHAIMNGVEVVSEISIEAAFHSLGGIQALYPLFEQLHLPIDGDANTENHSSQADNGKMSENGSGEASKVKSIPIILLDLLFGLVRISPSLGRQLIQTKGLLLLASALRVVSPSLLSVTLLNRLIDVARELVRVAESIRSDIFEPGARMHSSFVLPLLRHLHGYLFCNPDVWIRAPIEVQDQLYQFIATEFLPDLIRYGCISRTSSVIQAMHTLQYYYAIADPQRRTGVQLKTPDAAPLSNLHDVVKLRANLLFFVKQLVVRNSLILDSELQAILGYLLIVHEDENLHDIVYMLVTLVVEHPTVMGPVFLRNDGLYVAIKLLASEDEYIRIYALKLVGFYLQQIKNSKREDLMERYNLFTLVADRLSQFSTHLSLPIYNALFEVLVDACTSKPLMEPVNAVAPNMLIKCPSELLICPNKTISFIKGSPHHVIFHHHH